MAQRIQIPANFQEILPELKEKTFKWRFEYSSRTELSSVGYITHFSPVSTRPINGSIILSPGLASNCDTEPLMQAITYWALTKNFNIYTITTFLGDFKSENSSELAHRHTFPEFINLMEMGLGIIEEQCQNQWTCLIGHSVGGLGIIEFLNRRIQANKPLNFSSAILFAPYVTHQWLDFSKTFYRERNCPPETTDAEFAHTPIGLISPHDVFTSKQVRYISILPSFYDEMDAVEFRPDLMSKYQIPVTFVAGGRDKKSPTKMLQERVQTLQSITGNHQFKLIEFSNSKHSFIDQHRDYRAVIDLIKTQHVRRRRR